MDNLFVLTPAVAGIIVRIMVGRRLKKETDEKTVINIDENQVFSYSKTTVNFIFICAIICPLIIFVLPKSAVLDARSLFNFLAISSSLILLLSWVYLRAYSIKVMSDCIEYGAFFIKRVDLAIVTGIRYHWVNNGLSLKLYSGKKRIVKFEGGIMQFDTFAKCVKHRLPKGVRVETVGKASFE